MRNALNAALLEDCRKDDFCFLTGDLGFKALEPLQAAAGERFINMGIAEQNMVSVAAGLARCGLRPWVYSIAPFCYARPFEQIRNDVCFHSLPVRLIGNGAGYGYGVQGPSHHAIEDCAVMAALQNMRVYAPAFLSDIPALVRQLGENDAPAYMRLGRDEAPKDRTPPPYRALRLLEEGPSGVVLAFGSIAGSVWKAALEADEAKRPSVWCASELPVRPESVPEALARAIAQAPYFAVVEEHVATGGCGAAWALLSLSGGFAPRRFIHRCAKGYVSGRYGSQSFHREESGLDVASLIALFNAM